VFCDALKVKLLRLIFSLTRRVKGSRTRKFRDLIATRETNGHDMENDERLPVKSRTPSGVQCAKLS
jgi:hypothetical protein